MWASIKTITEIIGQGIGKAIKAIGTVLSKIGSGFGKLIDGAKAFLKGFGKNASKLFKVYQVEYKLYKMDRGKVTTILQEGDPFIKTVFDSSVWDKSKLDDLMRDIFKGASMAKDGTYNITYKGNKIVYWIRNKKLASFGIE